MLSAQTRSQLGNKSMFAVRMGESSVEDCLFFIVEDLSENFGG